MAKRRTFAEIREEAAHNARVRAIHECATLLRFISDERGIGDKLMNVMSKDNYKPLDKNFTPDDYFGTN